MNNRDMEKNFARLKAEHAELNHVSGAIETSPTHGDLKTPHVDAAHNEKTDSPSPVL